MCRKMFITLMCLLCLSPIIVRGKAAPQSQEIAQIGRPSIQAIDWNPKQDLIAVATAKEIWLYDAQLQDVAQLAVRLGLGEWNANGDIHSIWDWNIQQVKWSPDGHWLAISISVITGNGVTQPIIWQIWSWDGSQFTRILRQFPYLSALKWSPDDSQYALTNGSEISLFDTYSNRQLTVFSAIALEWSSDNQHIAVVAPEALQVIKTRSLKLETAFPDSDAGLRLALWNSDNTKIAAVGENRLYVWDVVTKKILVNLINFFPNPYYPEIGSAVSREPIRGIAWRPNHDELAVSYNSLSVIELGRLSIRDIKHNVEIHSSVQGGRLVEMRWTPNGRKFISSGATSYKFSEIIDMESTILYPPQDFPLTEWSYSPSEKHLIGYSHRDNLFSQLDPELFTRIKTFSGTADSVQAVSWSSDDNRFAVASHDELQIWDLSSGEKSYANFQHIGKYTNPTLWSHNGNYIALVSRNLPYRFSQMCDSVRIWDIKSRKPILSFPVNLYTSINWILDTNLLTISEPNYAEQPCRQPSKFTIVDVNTNKILTINHTQLVYLSWVRKIVDILLLFTG